MLIFIWMCVITQAFMPGGVQMVSLQAAAFQAHLRAELEMPAPESALIGAARHVARHDVPALAR